MKKIGPISIERIPARSGAVSDICGGCAMCCASVPAENVAGVDLVHDIFETGVVAVSNDDVRESLEL